MNLPAKKYHEHNTSPSPIKLGQIILSSALKRTPVTNIPCNWTAERLSEERLLYLALRADKGGHLSLDTTIISRRSEFVNEALTGLMQAEVAVRRLTKFLSGRVEFILFKGLALADSVYPAPHLRPCADVDILAHPQKATVLDRILLDAGYRRLLSSLRGGTLFKSSYLDPDDYYVEVHFHISPPDRRKPQSALAFEESRYEGEIRVFSAEMHLVALTLHAESHHFSLPLLNYLDVALMAIFKPWEPEKLYQLVSRHQCLRSLAVLLSRAEELIPEDVWEDELSRLFAIPGRLNTNLIRRVSSRISTTRFHPLFPILRGAVLFLSLPSFPSFFRSLVTRLRGQDKIPTNPIIED